MCVGGGVCLLVRVVAVCAPSLPQGASRSTYAFPLPGSIPSLYLVIVVFVSACGDTSMRVSF